MTPATTFHCIRKSLRLALVTLVLLLGTTTAFAQDVTLGPGLQSTLASMNPLERTTVVVTFDQDNPLTTSQIAAVQALGVTKGVYFESLPIMGVSATALQIQRIAGLNNVLSIWPNEELTYYNKEANNLTGVTKLRTDSNLRTSQGLPFSGKGITVVVNDSGIDASHPDLEYGSHVVENVLGSTNLNAYDTMLPITYVEGVINTDTNSGHGTHVAGTVGGTGVQSGGLYEGVAPGADLVGYGSGGVLLVLDALGGFDYAITHQFSFENPIRVITNSWGSSGTFDPANPVVQASYHTIQRNIAVLFAAGNEGSGENTHNPYAVAPWVISVGAGEKNAALADFSSRGLKGQSFTFTTYDGKTWTAKNELSVVAPGVDITSTCSAGSPLCLLGIRDDNPFYTVMQGTSMATPHVAGIVALMLEADPTLSPLEIKDIIMQTATNMPGREAWEVGAGFVNAYNAVVAALDIRTDFGATLNAERTFNSSANISDGGSLDFALAFSPVGDTDSMTFDVAGDVAVVKARADVPDNTVAIVLTDPDGNRYGSSITLPVLGESAGVAAPGKEGTWSITVSGIGSVSGVAVDPLGVTNGTALPGTIEGTIRFEVTNGFNGLNDIAGHPAQGFIESGVTNHLFDGFANGTFRPDALLTRAALAEYLVMGAGVRQSLPLNGGFSFSDVSSAQAPFVEAVAAFGGAMKDQAQHANAIIRTSGSAFNPTGTVTRAELAYSLMQSLGFQDIAAGFSGDVVVSYNGERIALDDQNDIPAKLRGYVQLALDTGVMTAQFSLEQGPFDPLPTLHATFNPNDDVTRAAYAVAATRLFNIYDTTTPAAYEGGTSNRSATASNGVEAETLDAEVPTGVELGANYPNPFNPSTQIQFNLSADGPVRLAVYNLLGQRVRVLVDSANLSAGAHQVTFEASDLASGTYLYRLETPQQTISRRMVLMK